MSCIGCLDRLKKMKNLTAHTDLIQFFNDLTAIVIDQNRDIFICEECEIQLTECCLFKFSCRSNYENLNNPNSRLVIVPVQENSECQPSNLTQEIKQDEEGIPLADPDSDPNVSDTGDEIKTEGYDDNFGYCDESDSEVPQSSATDLKKPPQLLLNYETGKMEVAKQRKLKGLEPETRKSYTAKTKIEIIQYAEIKGNREASRQYEINESSIRGWRKQKDKLLKMESDRKTFRKGSPYWPDLEKNLKTWVEQERSLGKTITSFHIKIEALRMARERNINNFSGTKKWCYSFMRRNQIPARSRKKRNPDGKSSNTINEDPSTSI